MIKKFTKYLAIGLVVGLGLAIVDLAYWELYKKHEATDFQKQSFEHAEKLMELLFVKESNGLQGNEGL